jgi:hypothetical protein
MHRMGELVEKTADEALRANGKKKQTATADATEFLHERARQCSRQGDGNRE